MRSLSWDRDAVITQVRRDIWRYLTAAARTDDEVILDAAALLQMSPAEVRTLAQLQFVLSDEVAHLLNDMPQLMRRLTTTTARQTESSAERIRGPIVWGETLSARAATGLPHLYVTEPARRAFDTPENQLLKFVLAAVAGYGRRTGWHRSSSEGAGTEVRRRVAEATRYLAVRSLAEVPLLVPSAQAFARVRSSRRRRLYEAAIATYVLYLRFLRQLDRDSVRAAIENHALVTSRNPVLLELLCAFTLVRNLQRRGWSGHANTLIRTPLIYRASRGEDTLELYYQHAPVALRTGSLYRHVQRAHAFEAVGGLIPDLVLRVAREPDSVRWIVIEVKGVERSVAESARAALQDLLAYRRAFAPALASQPGPYGVGIAWGEALAPARTDDVVLCSPDTIGDCLDLVA